MEPDVPLPLVIQRLMDADLIQPEEGLALLAEVDGWGQPADGEDTPESGSIRRPSLIALEALAQIDWSDAADVRAALDRVRILVKQSPGNLAAPAAETGEPRE
jgi:hypothetical protein